MDVGQSTANSLYQQAVDGTFKMDPDMARRCAQVYFRFVETTISPQIGKARRLGQLTGFGDFRSAQELQAGFSSKGSDLLEALQSIRNAALKMAAAHLRAAQLIDDTEADNTAAMTTAINGSSK